MISCAQCGTQTNKKKFCSRDCMYSSKRKTRKQCPNCGKDAPRAEMEYCSRKCYFKKKNEEYVKSIEYNTCKICGGKTTNEKYCSMKCLGRDKDRLEFTKANLKSETPWTEEEVRLLEESYGYVNINELSQMLNRKSQTVIAKASRLGIRSSRYWSNEDILYLIENQYENIEYLSEKLKKSISSIANKLTRINSKFDNDISPEEVCKMILDSLGIEYEREFQISIYRADFLVGDLVIEVNGTYWHTDKRFYKNGTVDAIQERVAGSDKRKYDYLTNEGFRVMYLWEYDLITNPTLCKELVIAELKSQN